MWHCGDVVLVGGSGRKGLVRENLGIGARPLESAWVGGELAVCAVEEIGLLWQLSCGWEYPWSHTSSLGDCGTGGGGSVGGGLLEELL